MLLFNIKLPRIKDSGAIAREALQKTEEVFRRKTKVSGGEENERKVFSVTKALAAMVMVAAIAAPISPAVKASVTTLTTGEQYDLGNTSGAVV